MERCRPLPVPTLRKAIEVMQIDFQDDLRTILKSGVRITELNLSLGVCRRELYRWLEGNPPYPRDSTILLTIHEWAKGIKEGTIPPVQKLREEAAKIYP